MSITPRISLVAWADRDPKQVFVAVPNEKGRFVRTDMSVILVDCPLCGAAIGEPCHDGKKIPRYWCVTHAIRRDKADRRKHPSLSAKPRYRATPNGLELIAEGTP